jgi:serine/threonine protein phosphatase 1
MTYVVSDIHGMYYKLMAMLKLIDFKDTDTMYILGDVIDRGKYPTRTLLYIIAQPNIHMLMGNHEFMMLEVLDPETTPVNRGIAYQCWMNNGGNITEEHFLGLCKEDKQKIVDYICDLPTVIELEKFTLVHAGVNKEYYEDIDFSLWAREEFYEHPTGLDKVVIFGHTPTSYLQQDKPVKIWHDPIHQDKICIDCGANWKNGRFACLRLDDMEEFYV